MRAGLTTARLEQQRLGVAAKVSDQRAGGFDLGAKGRRGQSEPSRRATARWCRSPRAGCSEQHRQPDHSSWPTMATSMVAPLLVATTSDTTPLSGSDAPGARPSARSASAGCRRPQCSRRSRPEALRAAGRERPARDAVSGRLWRRGWSGWHRHKLLSALCTYSYRGRKEDPGGITSAIAGHSPLPYIRGGNFLVCARSSSNGSTVRRGGRGGQGGRPRGSAAGRVAARRRDQGQLSDRRYRRVGRRTGRVPEFFSNMPADADPGMAFVLVQHLAEPNHESLLAETDKPAPNPDEGCRGCWDGMARSSRIAST